MSIETSLPSEVRMHPDQPLNCLLIQPEFCENNYWNYTAVARGIGAKTPGPPLGLLTVAAMLPASWTLKVVDLNVRELTAEEWDAADIICTGGMLPQQPATLAVIDRARAAGKYVAVGGPDITSQPEIYSRANARVLGEGENTIPLWLDAWRNGQPDGVFQATDRPDVQTSPVPRFDLIRFDDYVHVGLQLSRGCPFNCEFCDIIELYGRRPRTKTSAQFFAELEMLYQRGYRGWVDLVDDNFIGNKKFVKPLLAELATWCRKHNYPFYFSTEASMNLADDDELLELMQACDFRNVFMGIETPDPELLHLTQKPMNAHKPLPARIQRVYDHGIAIAAGFILGFDGEKPGSGKAIVDCVEQSGIVMAMTGLLVALPNTQLSRRLMKEHRLISVNHELITTNDQPYRLAISGTSGSLTDQAAGLNYVTTRDRVSVYNEYRDQIQALYGPKAFMDRVMNMVRRVNVHYSHRPSFWEFRRDLRGFLTTAWRMLRKPETRWLYVRNSFQALRLGPSRFDLAQRQMAMYAHFGPMSEAIVKATEMSIEFASNQATYPRQVGPEYQPSKNGCGTAGAAATQSHSATLGARPPVVTLATLSPVAS